MVRAILSLLLTAALAVAGIAQAADETAQPGAKAAEAAASGLGADDSTADPEAGAGAGAEGEEGDEYPDLTYQTGTIVLPNKAATLNLSDRYRYLDAEETEKLLVAWGNPPGSETLGSVVPAELSPFDDNGWAVIVTYIDDGHVDDKDAQEIDYAGMLADMKSETREGNKERVDAGYGAVELVGWAQQPRYDQAARKLFWAKELKFGESDTNTLNYDVRVLGREGVLSMNAVASMPQMGMVEKDMQDLLVMAAFNPGFRYEEFNADTDKVAAYGIGALVAGGLAAKAGLLAKLGALLLAAKKFIVIGLVALGGLLVRIFKGRKSADGQPT